MFTLCTLHKTLYYKKKECAMVKNLNVKKTLLEENLQIKNVAKQIGYTRSHVSGVINGRFDSPKVKKSISLLLGKDFDYLWSTNSTAQAENQT